MSDLDKKIANSDAINVLMKHLVEQETDNNINKRGVGRPEIHGGCYPSLETICIASGKVKYKGKWTDCNFDCFNEPNWACASSCSVYRGCACA